MEQDLYFSFVLSQKEILDNEIDRLHAKIKSLPKAAQKHFKQASPGAVAEGLIYEDLSGLYTLRNTLVKILKGTDYE